MANQANYQDTRESKTEVGITLAGVTLKLQRFLYPRDALGSLSPGNFRGSVSGRFDRPFHGS